MKKISFFISLICILILSCNVKKTEEVYLKNSSLATGFNKAVEQNKGLLLISSKSGCSMCEMFDASLIKDKEFADLIFENYVVMRVDDNATGQKWLNRILNGPGVPTFLFFSADKKLSAVKIGAMDKHQAKVLIDAIAKKAYLIDPKYKFGKANAIPNNRIKTYLENLIIAQWGWEKFQVEKDQNALNAMLPPLSEAINIKSSFYNNYLLTQYYRAKDDTLNAKKQAENALIDEDPATLYFNAGLRTELKTLLNKKYSDFDDAYIGFDQTEQQLGKLKFGSTTKISFTVKNLGKQNLVIKQVYPDCGCTIARYTKTPILPNKTGFIELNYKAQTPGDFAHAAYVQSNAVNNATELYIKGIVLGN